MTTYIDSFNLINTAILITNEAGQIIWANNASEQLFKTSINQLESRSIFKILKPLEGNSYQPKNTPSNSDLSTNNILQALINYDQWIIAVHEPMQVDYSVTPVSVDNSLRILASIQNKKIKATSGKNQSLFLIEVWAKDRQDIIIHDQYDDNQYKIARNMLRSIAHEIKNPLAGIRGATQLLQKLLKSTLKKVETSDSTNKKLDTYTNIIINETDRLNDLIAQLLGTNKPPVLTEVNIHQSLEHVLTLAHSQYEEVLIKRDYDLSMPDIIGDNNQLIQVFLNLVNNAMQAMQSVQQNLNTNRNYQSVVGDEYQPQLTVSTRVQFRKTVKINSGSKLHKNIAKITINDNGDGIPSELIKQIFFPLVTGRADGTGLGLALVHNIIQKHNGTIEVDSQAGSTNFILYLPFADFN